jgi:hypothetical protein
MNNFKVGDKVYFGRAQGEKTLGEIVKVNRSSVKVKQLESRGTMRDYKVGMIWKVAPTLIYPADLNAAPKKRDESTIMKDIVGCYCSLSPENLTGDGEYPRHIVERRRTEYNQKLLALLNEIGRHVSEDEAYASDRAASMAANPG